MCLMTFGAAIVGAGVYTFVKYAPPQESVLLPQLGHRNDTILLEGGIDAYVYSYVSVSQCIQPGDAAHLVNVGLVEQEKNKLKEKVDMIESPVFIQDSPSYKSGILDYLYLTEDSSFMYNICMASTTGRNKNATYYLFDDIESYWNYISSNEDGKKYSTLSKPVAATKNNQTTCTEIVYNVTDPGYFFMVVLTPADVYYFYQFSLRSSVYGLSNASQICKVSDLNKCNFTLAGHDFQHKKYDVLAYIQPDDSETSIITHLCLTRHGGSTTLHKISYIASALVGTGALMIICCTIVIGCVAVLHLCRSSKKAISLGEKQKLLNNY